MWWLDESQPFWSVFILEFLKSYLFAYSGTHVHHAQGSVSLACSGDRTDRRLWLYESSGRKLSPLEGKASWHLLGRAKRRKQTKDHQEGRRSIRRELRTKRKSMRHRGKLVRPAKSSKEGGTLGDIATGHSLEDWQMKIMLPWLLD